MKETFKVTVPEDSDLPGPLVSARRDAEDVDQDFPKKVQGQLAYGITHRQKSALSIMCT